jgi:hypothetical protein
VSFDFTDASFAEWDAGLPDGEFELLSHRHQLGELSVSVIVHGRNDSRQAYEMLVKPKWFCVFEDERQQVSLLRHMEGAGVPTRMFEITDSPVVNGLLQVEPLFNWPDERQSHWAILGLESCCHVISAERPSFRKIYGASQ